MQGERATVTGEVAELLPRGLYRIAIGDGRQLVAHPASGVGRNFIRLVVGDRVTVEVSSRDAGRGRIVRRG